MWPYNPSQHRDSLHGNACFRQRHRYGQKLCLSLLHHVKTSLILHASSVFCPHLAAACRHNVACRSTPVTYLCTFLEHGEIEISNNQVENVIRPFVAGRKGWLFIFTRS
ncbi:MAG: transposase [Aristaeellaceae bacterium]